MFAGSNNQRRRGVKGRLYSYMFDALIPCGTKIVKPKRVLAGFDCFFQAVLQFHITSGIDLAFKNGKLHPLSVVETDFGDTAKAFFSSFGRCGDIISDQHMHGVYLQINEG